MTPFRDDDHRGLERMIVIMDTTTPTKTSSFTIAQFVPTNKLRYGRHVFAVYGLSFDIFHRQSGLRIRVPDGFETDGPSWPLWIDSAIALLKKVMTKLGYANYIPDLPDAHMIKSCALHDYLRERFLIPKLFGDYIFLTALKAEGCSFVFRWFAFLVVLCNVSRKRAKDTSFVITESPNS
jgi:hypothetical protein